MRTLALLLLALCACRAPDDISTGIGWRDEEFGGHFTPSTDYTGGQVWVSGTWHLTPQPVSLSLDTDTRLFLQGERPANGGPVSVNVEKPDAPKSVIGELAEAGKDKDGNWTRDGVFALLILAAVAVVFLLAKRSPKS